MRKIIVGNWKMYPSLSDAVVLAGSLRQSLESIHGVTAVLAPPTAWLLPVLEHWKHKMPHVHFAAQNVWSDDQGAYTGEVSAYLLKDIVSYAIIGHSERRRYLGEDNETINDKLLSCLRWRIKPILCVGETKKAVDANGNLAQVEWGKIVEQLEQGLSGVKREYLEDVIIAYEPVWAIGNGNEATAEYAVAMIERLRSELTKQFGTAADTVHFLYGGSVDATNAGEYLRHKEISGLLVGTASVKAKEFASICRIAADLAK
jgi:triosephosphate isomerase (TIM)